MLTAVVADANALLSAVIGKAALKVFTEHSLVVHATEFNVLEVDCYLPRMAQKYGLVEHLVQLHWRLLPVIRHPRERYEPHLAWARRILRDRDPDDAHPLALCRTLELPLWSNDKDFHAADHECLPTARLLRLLES